jgi:hypothetical protein
MFGLVFPNAFPLGALGEPSNNPKMGLFFCGKTAAMGASETPPKGSRGVRQAPGQASLGMLGTEAAKLIGSRLGHWRR